MNQSNVSSLIIMRNADYIVLVINFYVHFFSRWNLILLLSVCSAVLSGEEDYRAQGKDIEMHNLRYALK